ncbi:MAG: TetR/AcrR family transcriptional regulator [Terriglobales bacterium]|jgi:AcrR family transcriptional regulator
MSRPINEKRPEELRNAIVRYLIKHGLTGLSLRPLAKALGCTPRVLLYHFGSKEKMVVEMLAQVRQGQRVAYGRIEEASFTEGYLTIWKRMSAPDSEPLFRLFFEAYGIALRSPRLYKAFLHDTIQNWLQLMTHELEGERYQCRQARAIATIVLAGLRGFMLDFCTTHDRKRVDEAVELWLRSLDSMLTTLKEAL